MQMVGVQNVRNQHGLRVMQMGLDKVLQLKRIRDLDEIEEVNANYGSTEVHEYDNCYNNEIFNMFTQEEQYTKLLEPIPELHQVQQNDNNVISVVSRVEQGGGTVEQNPATIEETRAYFKSLYNNLAIKVEKVNSVNRKMKETNADLATKLARYKNQEKCFEINQEKYDKLKRCYQKSVYQEQCLTKKINSLHLSSAITISTLNKEIANLNNQLSKDKSTVSSLQKEKKKLKSDFKIRKTKLLDKQIQFENKIKELDNILEAAKFVRDFKSLAKEADESLAKHKALEFEIERLLKAVVSQDIMSIVQSNSVADTSNLQTKLDPYNDMKQKFKRLQDQLGDLNGKSKDTPCKSDTLDPLSQKLENENVSEQKEITKGTSVNTKFANQLTERKPSLQSLRNNFVVRQPNAFQSERQNFSKIQVPLKVLETNDLSNPITSNLVPTTTESIVVTNDKVIAPGMFRINLFKTSREDKFVPINKVRENVRINPITISRSHVITKKHLKSDLNGLSSTREENIAKTRRPQPKSNTKNDRVPFASKSSCINNKEVEVEEHYRNLLVSKNKKHMSSECNNIKLAIQNNKSEFVYAMCKQCLITSNHDVYVLNYVNDISSRVNKFNANVSNTTY
ncbi:hypothetical protein Tco_0692134 [Tanacetum coccineum]